MADVFMLPTCSPEDLRALTRLHKIQDEPVNWEKEKEEGKLGKGLGTWEAPAREGQAGLAAGSLTHPLLRGRLWGPRLTLGPADQGREPGQASRDPGLEAAVGQAVLARLLASRCGSSWRTEGRDLQVAPAPRSSLEAFQWPQLPPEVHRAPQPGLLAPRASGLADWTVSLVCGPGRMCERPAGHRVRLPCSRCVTLCEVGRSATGGSGTEDPGRQGGPDTARSPHLCLRPPRDALVSCLPTSSSPGAPQPGKWGPRDSVGRGGLSRPWEQPSRSQQHLAWDLSPPRNVPEGLAAAARAAWTGRGRLCGCVAGHEQARAQPHGLPALPAERLRELGGRAVSPWTGADPPGTPFSRA